MIRVFVADDHPIVREGLKRLIEVEEGLDCVGEAATSVETYRKVLETEVDVLLLDLEMPGRGGLDVLRDLRKNRPGLGVLVLSHFPEDPYAVRAIQTGASGFLNKEAPPDQLLAAIRKVGRGKKYISRSVAAHLAVYVGGMPGAVPHEKLSHREFQVLCLIGKGFSVSEIAAELSLSAKTVSTYRSRLLEKMDLSSNGQLMRYAIDHGLA
jgi:DNA-binding NarL/FixJ family response regulator